VTNHEIGDYPALSPDGERLAFIKYDHSNQSANLSVLNLANREEITLAQDALWPSWHPDGIRAVLKHAIDNAIHAITIHTRCE
jgi:Tol biopolymer transport system component